MSISELLGKVHDEEIQEQENREKQKTKHRTLGLDVENVLPTGHKKYNTREPIPVRKRQNMRTKRDNVKNKYYSDNLDEYHLEVPKRRRKQNVPSRLRSPSNIRIEAQRIIKSEKGMKEEPGTAIKNEDKKPDVELSETEMKRIEKRNKERNKHKKWPHDAKLVHIDGTSCSLECMKTSDYHKDMDEVEFDKIKKQKQQSKLPVATSDEPIGITTEEINPVQPNKLTVATVEHHTHVTASSNGASTTTVTTYSSSMHNKTGPPKVL